MKSNDHSRRENLLLLALGIAIFGVVSCGSSSIPTATELTTIVSPVRSKGVEEQVGEEIARYRRSHGLTEQTRDRDLDRLARLHAQEMLARGKMGHENYHKRLGMAEAYYGLGGLRENVAHGKGFSPANMSRVMVEGWIDSPGHRMNLLSLTTHYGVGVAIGDDGSFYAAQLTATPIAEQAANSGFRPGMPISYSNLYGSGQGPDW